MQWTHWTVPVEILLEWGGMVTCNIPSAYRFGMTIVPSTLNTALKLQSSRKTWGNRIIHGLTSSTFQTPQKSDLCASPLFCPLRRSGRQWPYQPLPQLPLYWNRIADKKKKKKLTGTEIAVEERPPLDRKALNLFSSLPQPYKSKGLAFLFLPTRLVHSLGPQLHWP